MDHMVSVLVSCFQRVGHVTNSYKATKHNKLDLLSLVYKVYVQPHGGILQSYLFAAIGPVPFTSSYVVRLGSGILLFQCLQYDWAREFPDYRKCLTYTLSLDHRIISSHDPFMYNFI